MDPVCTQLNTFISNNKFESNWNWQETWALCKATLQHILVPHLKADRPPEESDYSKYKSLTETRLQYFVRFLELVKSRHKESHPIELDKEFSGLLVIFCGQHHSIELWSTFETVRESTKILSLWNQVLGRNSLNEACSFVLNYLCPTNESEWKSDSCATYLFVWLVFNVNFSMLVNKEHKMMFTIALRLLDDFQFENRMTGIECMSHIVNNVTSADFYQYNLVVNDALIQLLGNPEPEVITSLIPCLMITFQKTQLEEIGTGNYNIPFAWSYYDEVFTSILRLMECKEGSPLSRACLQTLPLMLEACNILTVRYHQRIFTLINKYLAFEDSRKDSQMFHQLSLNVLKAVIKASNDHLSMFSERVCFILLKRKFTLNVDEGRIHNEIEEMLGMLTDLSVPILNMDA